MNVAILIGRLTKDPELRYIPSTGKAVATFAIAVDRPFTSKDGQRQTDFFNIVVWGKIAENCANYLSKGRLVGIKGQIQNRSYYTQNGEKRFVTEIIADTVQFLEKAQGASPRTDLSQGFSNAGSDIFEPSGFQAPEGFSPKGLDDEGYRALEDDDVPF